MNTENNVNILKRQRIHISLLETIKKYSIVSVVAPFGYGKTTIACSITGEDEKICLYINLKSSKIISLDDFIKYIYASVYEGVVFDNLCSVDNNKNSCLIDRACEFFLKHMDERYEVIIIDDYHSEHSPEIDNFLSSLVQEKSPRTHFLILSRNRPTLPLESMRVKGLAAAFDESLLSFSRQEVFDLFQSSDCHDTEAADCAWKLSEGWPAAVQLCLNGCRENGGDPTRELEQLFSEVFLSEYTHEEQLLFLKIAVLENCTAGEAVLLSEQSAVQMLRELHSRGAFIRYSHEKNVYTIQSFFRNFLIKCIDENTFGACRYINKEELYRAAGTCSLQRGEHMKAIRFFLKAGGEFDMLSILQMFASGEDKLFIADCPKEIFDIIDAMPWHIRDQCPLGYLGFIYNYMVLADKEKAYALLIEVERHIDDEKNFSSELRTQLQGEIQVLYALYNATDIEEMIKHHEKAYTLFRGTSSLLDSNIYWAFTCPHSAFLFLKEPGTYAQLVDNVDKKIMYFQNISNGSSEGANDLLHAEYLLETGEPLNAAHLLAKAKYKAKRHNQHMPLLSIAFTRSRLYIAQGNTQKAWEEMENITGHIMEAGNPFIVHALDLCRGYIAAVLDMPKRIPDWLQREEVPFAQKFYPNGSFAYIVQGKVFIALKKWGKLEALADDALEKKMRLQCLFGHVHFHIFKAIALDQTQNIPQAQAQLNLALELCLPDGIITTVAEYGKYIHQLLQRLHEFGTGKTLAVIGKTAKKYSKLTSGNAFNLTLRERQILEKVIAGQNNKIIGTELGITAGSVANTLSRIYIKMDVPNRSVAIRRWLEEEAAAGLPPDN